MALAERLSKQPAPTHGLPCSVGVLLNTLEGDERDALLTMLGTPEQRGWSASEIFDALTAEGYRIAFRSINPHRGGKCRCASRVAS